MTIFIRRELEEGVGLYKLVLISTLSIQMMVSHT